MNPSSILQGGYAHPFTRSLQAERSLTKEMLMYPIFITDDPNAEIPIKALPNQKRWGINKLEEFLTPLIKKGLKSIIIFGVPMNIIKDQRGTSADDPNGPVIQSIKTLKLKFPQLFIAVDVCLCEYTDHGHCGFSKTNIPGQIDTDLSVKRITQVALSYAKAGADCVAPSDMMDGRIGSIKIALIEAGLANRCCLMSYSAKFASSLYGPFREAAGSTPSFGDRKCYQLPPNARGLARRAIRRDVTEGADIIMIKPALPYLDIISDARTIVPDHPLACYQVSGEYMMIWNGAQTELFELRSMVLESLNGMLRSGVSLILSYFTPLILDWLDEDQV
ncbi:delta-aminolevulinic acid dehydratase [Melampsora americana]|nr:delta-aminolevulinic acid dehydratase [Melampsora americana]